MSQHRSLKTSGNIRKKRSVLKRYERVDILQAQEQWDEKKSVFGLPKTKSS